MRGPRLQISLTMLSQTGGHGDGWMPSGGTGRALPRLSGHAGVDRRRRRRGAAQGARARPRRRRRDQDRDLAAASSRRATHPPARLRVEEIEVDGRGGARRRALGDVARAVDRSGSRTRFAPASARSSTASTSTTRRSSSMLEHGAYLVPTLVAPLGVIKRRRGRRADPRGRPCQGARGRRGAPGLLPARRRGRRQGRDGHRRRGRPARHEPRGAAADGRRRA